MLTFVGLMFIVPMLDITLKVEALITFLTLWLAFIPNKNFKKERVVIISRVEKVVRNLFGMSFFEIQSFEQ